MSTSEFTKCTLLMFVKQWSNNTVKQSKTYLKAREKAKQAELFLNIFCFRPEDRDLILLVVCILHMFPLHGVFCWCFPSCC